MKDRYFNEIPKELCISFTGLELKYGFNSEEELKKEIYERSVWEFSKEYSKINGISLDDTNYDYIKELHNEYYSKELEKSIIHLINQYREAKEELIKEWSDK